MQSCEHKHRLSSVAHEVDRLQAFFILAHANILEKMQVQNHHAIMLGIKGKEYCTHLPITQNH